MQVMKKAHMEKIIPVLVSLKHLVCYTHSLQRFIFNDCAITGRKVATCSQNWTDLKQSTYSPPVNFLWNNEKRELVIIVQCPTEIICITQLVNIASLIKLQQKMKKFLTTQFRV